ncbi:MAG: transcriptional repressor [Oscillospiraceae bacterium]|jgi:Fur family peroxide stress response transcriptional regulator|nr:transcriptional repressor [Oscillospiraceae bacterium]
MDAKRNTIQRKLILDAVRKLDAHATAEQVYEYVSKEYPSISKATVYRNLSLLTDAGELANIMTFSGAARYDHNLHRHCHFICEGCGRVFDIEGVFPEADAQKLNGQGFEIKSICVTLSGICPDCGEKGKVL